MSDVVWAPDVAPLRWESRREGDLHCEFRADLSDALAAVYARSPWVYDAFLAQRDAVLLRGRRPVVSGRLGETGVVVKRMYHGGLFARIFNDAFLTPARLRAHVPLAEYLLRNGVATAPVVFTSWRRRGGLVRCEIGFELIEDGVDADRYFFGDAQAPEGWKGRAQQIGALVARLSEIGFLHVDLNLMNFLFGRNGEIYVLDLDKSVTLFRPYSPGEERRVLDRLERSIRKQGRRHDPEYVDALVRRIRTSCKRALA